MKDLEKYLELFEKYRAEHGSPKHLDSLYEPIEYLLGLSGKRIRPMFCLLFCDLYGGEPETALPAALAIEYFHNFTLMHDDIMDQAPRRRGHPSVHFKYSTSQAILSGDALFTLSLLELDKLEPALHRKANRLFLKTALEVCEGQQLDMDFEEMTNISEEAYLNMIKLKTSVLLACSAALGAIIAGASEEQVDSAYAFALNLGISFQIKDDWLDTFGVSENVGKQRGGDILTNKKTLLYIEAIYKATDSQLGELSQLYDKTKSFENDDKVKRVTNIFRELNIDHIVEQKMITYYNRAIDSIENFGLLEAKRTLLSQLAEYIISRVK